MEEDFGANLSPYQGLTYFTGNSPKDLLDQLKQIKVQYKILSIYAQGSNHVAWVDSGAIKLKKVTNKKTKE